MNDDDDELSFSDDEILIEDDDRELAFSCYQVYRLQLALLLDLDVAPDENHRRCWPGSGYCCICCSQTTANPLTAPKGTAGGGGSATTTNRHYQ